MNQPSEEEILKAINESGYLFEQEIGSIIEELGFHIQTNSAFKDLDEEKSRELDVTGYKSIFYDEERKISIGIRVLCECKNNRNPFVFINRNKSIIDKRYCPPNFLFPQEKFNVPIEGKPNHFRIKEAFEYYNLNEIFPYSINEHKAVQFCKLVQKNKEWSAFHDGIYDSIIIPLSKGLEYYKQKDKGMRSDTWKNYIIYFPLVILNSKIFAIDSHIDNNKVYEVGYTSFTREIESKKQKGKYLIDFISKEFIKDYFNNYLGVFAEKFIEKITLS